MLGVSGAVFLDVDGNGRFDSALDYARRAVSVGEVGTLLTRLGGYDRAVAVQAASLLRHQDPVGFEKRIRSMIEAAPAGSDVIQGFTAYLDAWTASGRVRQ